MKIRVLSLSIVLGMSGLAAFAQNTADTVQRDVNQQTRIETGLKDGSLTTREAGRLEREQSQIDRLQAKELKDGKLTPAEQAQLRRLQNRASRDIKAAETNGAKGNPNSASSERMQADVQRNVNQEKRIESGVQSGQLTNKEAGNLEQGQSRVDRKEARAAKNGHIGKREQARIQRAENKQSDRIFDEKHDPQTRAEGGHVAHESHTGHASK